MDVSTECISMAFLGALAYELMIIRDVWERQFRAGRSMTRLRGAYVALLVVWLPVVAVLSYQLFRSNDLPPAKYILIGFAFPTVIKTLTHEFTARRGRNLGDNPGLLDVLGAFFYIGER
jgi:hypothetical protein